jgi:hypothetical protein
MRPAEPIAVPDRFYIRLGSSNGIRRLGWRGGWNLDTEFAEGIFSAALVALYSSIRSRRYRFRLPTFMTPSSSPWS